jgi:SAM-dependent methyltransferase
VPERYLPIDEEGYWIFDGRRVDDPELGRRLLSNMKLVERDRWVTSMDGENAWVEAFDAPLIARHVSSDAPGFVGIELPYATPMRLPLQSLTVDEWDRFHGVTEAGVPVVLSRQAQVEFFDLLEEFDDESVTIGGQRYATPAWLSAKPDVNQSGFWTDIYQTTPSPNWDLGYATKILPAILPQLKLNRRNVLVLGCGLGHDAAALAELGHLVTGVDFSAAAVEGAQKRYGKIEGLKFVQADAFNLPKEFVGRFDLIFEHTCYCAISPERRSELVDVWNKALTPRGELLAIFFANERRQGPPFGGSEWELRQRLKEHFDFLFWTRWRQSEEERKSQELVVFARKKG